MTRIFASGLGSEMNTYLYQIQPSRPEMLSEGPTAREDEIISAHFEYLSDLHDKGVVWMAGRTLDETTDSFGIIIFYAEDDSAAETLVRDDPAVKKGVMLAKIFPFRIAIL